MAAVFWAWGRCSAACHSPCIHAVAYTNDYIDAEDRVPASGGLMISYGIGASIGPTLGSVAMDFFGASGLFAFIGAIAVALTVFIGWRITQRASPPLADQGEYQALQRTSPVAYEMYPDGSDDEDPDPEDETRC